MMDIFYHLNHGQDNRNRFYFTSARHADDPNGLGYYLPVIKEHLKVNRKILHFGCESHLTCHSEGVERPKNLITTRKYENFRFAQDDKMAFCRGLK